MKTLSKFFVILTVVLSFGLYLNNSSTFAQQTKCSNPQKGFIDLNGDGINDNAIDSDGDGIPNGQDPDYVRPQDGTGQKFMHQNKFKALNQNKFKYMMQWKGNGFGKSVSNQLKGAGNKLGNNWGPGDGTGNNHIGPQDGTGYGSGAGSGICDGTGPNGKKRGGR